MKILACLLTAIITLTSVNAQNISTPDFLKIDIDLETKNEILVALDTLFAQIKVGKINAAKIGQPVELSMSVLASLAGVEANKTQTDFDFYKKQLINLYPISLDEYFASIAFIGSNQGESQLKTIFNLIAKRQNNEIVLSIPIVYLTRKWTSKTIGNITYIFNGPIRESNARKFNAKNTAIATRLGLRPEAFTFYMCDNYQEILRLLGYGFDRESNGITRDGYGVDSKTIFSIMNNEDFSHDIFHYYSAKVRGEAKRNRTVEEGLAYSWGNAYYTANNGAMIEQREIILELKSYLKENPGSDLLHLFKTNARILKTLAPEISLKSTISSLLCDEVERKKGLEGIKALITCGPTDEDFFRTLDGLVSINQQNFNAETARLIVLYKAH